MLKFIFSSLVIFPSLPTDFHLILVNLSLALCSAVSLCRCLGSRSKGSLWKLRQIAPGSLAETRRASDDAAPDRNAVLLSDSAFFFFLSNSVAAGRRCLSRERAYAAFGRANIDLRNGFGGSSELYLIINTINAFLCRLQIFDLYSALEEDGSSPAFFHLISQRYLWLTSSKAEGMIPAWWASDTDEK